MRCEDLTVVTTEITAYDALGSGRYVHLRTFQRMLLPYLNRLGRFTIVHIVTSQKIVISAM
jgi:hypothetical protein